MAATAKSTAAMSSGGSGGTEATTTASTSDDKATASTPTRKSASTAKPSATAAAKSAGASSKTASGTVGKAEPRATAAKPSAVAAAVPKPNPAHAAKPTDAPAAAKTAPAADDSAKAVAAIDKGAARLPTLPDRSVNLGPADGASLSVAVPRSTSAETAFPVAAQCVVPLPAVEPVVADASSGAGSTVEIALSDAVGAVVEENPDGGIVDTNNAGNAADATPARVDTRPPGPGVVPPDILAFALRSHALYPVVPISVTLAQWAKESGWSLHMPPNSNNPFGIKCYDPDKGCAPAKTAEQDVKGRQSILTQKFQAFATMDEAFVSHARILATLSVYDRARNASDIDGFARGLKAYATDIDYTASLIRDYLKPYNLYKYDECEGAIAAW